MVTRAVWIVAGWLIVSAASAQSAGEERAIPRPVDGQTLQATGYVLPQGQVELGILFAGYGITDWLTVGLQPIPWIVAPILGGVSANASVKLGFALGSLLDLSLEVTPIWFRIEDGSSDTRGILLPITLATSFHPTRGQSYSLAVRYSSVEGLNDSEIATQEVGGTALARVLQLIGQVQFQLTGSLSIYVQGQLQSWEQELRIHGSSRISDRTRIEIEGAASSMDQSLPWAVLAGIHVRHRAVNVRLGAGYGNVFVPRVGLTTRRYEGVVPDLDFFVRF